MSQDKSRAAIAVLFIDDDAGLRKVMGAEIGRMGYSVDTVGDVASARKAVAQRDYDVIFLDLRMPGMSGDEYLAELRRQAPASEVIVVTGHANVDIAVECMKQGAYDFLTKPCPLDRIEILIGKAAEKRRLATSLQSLQHHNLEGGGVGSSKVIQDIQETISRLDRTDEPVLILGESGTGKELLAREIQRRSLRAAQAFITVNCSAFSESLLESELFGHERGAFTGADARRIGVFQLADQGTIFLDEIGDMPPPMQAKLLRTLQSGELRPVGGQKNIFVDVRVISATNQDLPKLVADGRFRADLFYRLNTITLTLPPLRRRGGDIEELAGHFLQEYCARSDRRLSFDKEVLAAFRTYPWPGNIRELQNVVKQAAILCAGEVIQTRDLPDYVLDRRRNETGGLDVTQYRVDELDKIHLVRMLEACHGNKRETARRLGISNKTLYNKMHAYGLELNLVASESA